MLKRILIVDDDPDILFAVKRILAGPDVELATAQGKAEAEALLEDLSPDVLIADLMLASRDPEEGLALVQSVRANYPATRVLVVTGCGEPDIMKRAADAGAHLALAKPIGGRDLRDALSRLGA